MKTDMNYSFFEFFSNDKYLRIIFCILLVFFVCSLYIYDRVFFDNYAGKIFDSFKSRDLIMNTIIDNNKDSLVQIEKLKNQYNIIQTTKGPYLSIARIYSSNGYSFTIIFTFCSILTAILGFFIVNKGWENTNNFYLKSSFIIFFFFSSFSGVLQKVTNTTENTKKNMEKYYYYNGLQIDIIDLINDNKGYFKRQEYGKVDSLISGINDAIKNNTDIYFDIYIDKVPQDIKPFR